MIRKFLSIACLALGAMFAFASRPIEFAVTLAATAFRCFSEYATAPLRAEQTARPASFVPVQRSRVRSFLSRALKHPSFAAGHFDPGRMPA